MENDPLATLAPPDPTWNPPPMPPPGAADMLAARGVSDAPPPPAPADPNMIAPAAASAPYTPPVPSEIAPNNPDMERQHHESTWRRILDKVGSILGGDTTIHVTKDKDGNVSVTHDPSTSGEKWSRIAATALGGAAQGIANSRGPGGNFRAAAAGTQFGLQAKQQREDDADKQATAEQKRQILAANNTYLHQKSIQATLESKDMELSLDQKTKDVLEGVRHDLASSPYAHDYGPVSNMQEVMDKVRESQNLRNEHTNLQLKTTLMPKKGGGWETHLITSDPGDDAQPITKGTMMPKIDVDPKTGEPTLSEEPASMGQNRGAFNVARTGVITKFGEMRNNWVKDNRPPATKAPTPASLAWMATNSPDLAERERAKQALALLKPAKTTGSTIGDMGQAAGADMEASGETIGEQRFNPDGTPLPSPVGQQILDNLSRTDAGTAALIRRIGEYRGAEADLPRGKERAPFMKLVSQVYPGFDSKEYKARVGLLDSWRYGQLSQARQSANTLVNHMGNLFDAMTSLNPSESTDYNAVLGFGRGRGFGSKEAKDAQGKYDTAATGVASEAAKTFKGGGGGTQTETNEWRKRMDRNAPASMQKGAFNETFDLLTGRLDSIQNTLQTGFHTDQPFPILSDHAIKTLQRIPGGQAILDKYNVTSANTNSVKPSAATPGGEGIPEPIAPARPQPIPGTLVQNGVSSPVSVTAQGIQPATKDRSVSKAMALPMNQNKTKAEVEADLKKYGYNPVP